MPTGHLAQQCCLPPPLRPSLHATQQCRQIHSPKRSHSTFPRQDLPWRSLPRAHLTPMRFPVLASMRPHVAGRVPPHCGELSCPPTLRPYACFSSQPPLPPQPQDSLQQQPFLPKSKRPNLKSKSKVRKFLARAQIKSKSSPNQVQIPRSPKVQIGLGPKSKSKVQKINLGQSSSPAIWTSVQSPNPESK